MAYQKWNNPTNTPTYNSWRSMRYRILYPGGGNNHDGYKSKGINICPEWLESYDQFYEDMGERPEGTTLDRIDPNGNYEPANCRWACWRTQQNNKKDLTEVEHNGETKTIGQWCYELDLTPSEINTVYKRHSAYNATTYEELFSKNLYSYRKSLEEHECVICHTTESIKWRKGACNKCYARALRYFKKHNKPIDIAGYATLVEKELIGK